MNRMLNMLGISYKVIDIATSNMCMTVALDKYYGWTDHNSKYHIFIWETRILKSVWYRK